MRHSENEETFSRSARPRRGTPIPLHMPRIYEVGPGTIGYQPPRRSKGLSRRGLLVLLGFIVGSFLIVVGWPYRVLILHIAIVLLALLVFTLLLIATIKVCKAIRRWRAHHPSKRQKLPLDEEPVVHETPPGGYTPSQPSLTRYYPPQPEAQCSYDDLSEKRYPGRLNPGQGDRS